MSHAFKGWGLRTPMVGLGMALLVPVAEAQTAQDLIGTWEAVSIVNTAPDGKKSEPFGSSPQGRTVFGADGRFVQVVIRPGIPKFASNNRMQGTAEENKAVVQSSVAYFGTYKVADKVLILQVEASTWPGWVGSEEKRPITSLSANQLELTIAANIGGTNTTVWRRAK